MIVEIFKGVIIGIANIIPGVSGGTLALSMGIYDKIIFAITHIFKEFKKSVKILVPLVIGAGIEIGILSIVIEWLFDKCPFQTNMLFIGLILGGLPMLFQKVRKEKIDIKEILAFTIFFLIVILSSIFGEKNYGDVIITFTLSNCIKLFIVGIIASATMVIPGVSGTMILMLMGYYNPILSRINQVIKLAVKFEFTKMIEEMLVLIPFGIGVIAGTFALAKVIEFVFEKYSVLSYFAIIGLIVASPIAIIMMNGMSNLSIVSLITGVLSLGIGLFTTKYLG